MLKKWVNMLRDRVSAVEYKKKMCQGREVGGCVNMKWVNLGTVGTPQEPQGKR